MKNSSHIRAAFLTLVLLSLGAVQADAQRAVVSHDEWLTGASTFNAGEQQFVNNALGWFGLSGSGNVLVYSSNSFLTNTPFIDYLTGLGYSVTIDAAATTFSGYSAVFGGGNSGIDGSGLASYVSGGGNVFYVGGTGIGGAAAEAAYSNSFLNALGLSFASTYNSVGTVNTTGFDTQGPFGGSLFSGVSSIYGLNGNNISSIGSAGWTTQVFADGSGNGVYGAVERARVSVPEPNAVLLLIGGMLGLGLVAWRRREMMAA